MRRPPFTLQEASWYLFLLEAESAQGYNAAEMIRQIEKSSDFIRNGTLDLPACSIVPHALVAMTSVTSCSELEVTSASDGCAVPTFRVE
jgi:hypothetical protein